MKKKNSLRGVALLQGILLILLCTACGKAPASGQKLNVKKLKDSLAVKVSDTESTVGMENENFLFILNKETASFSVTDRKSGETYLSIVPDASDDKIVTGKERTKMSSILKFSYLDVKNEIVDTANTKADAVKTDEETGKSIANVKIVPGESDIVVSYIFTALQIVIPVRFALCDDGFTCSVLTSKIVEHSNFRVMTVTLLPYFGAARQTENGYLLLPDGSGSIAYLHGGKESYETYSAQVYGTDYCFDLLTDSDKVQSVRLPVFGMNRVSGGFLGIITEGESLAKLEAAVNGQISEYACVCATFTARSTYTYTMGESNGGSKSQTVYVYEEKDLAAKGETTVYSTGNFTVRYCLLDRENCDYCGMARKYREYLTGILKIKEKKNVPAVTVEMPGAVRTEKKFFGCSVYTTRVLNGVNDIEHTVKKLADYGVDHVNVKYTDWTKQQLKGNVSDNARVLSTLGGGKAVSRFLKESGEDVRLYLNTDFFSTKHHQLRYASGKYSAKNVSGKIAQKYSYELENYLRNPKIAPVTLIAPSQMYQPLNRFLDAAERLGNVQISLSETAGLLSSDFTEVGWTREHSKREIMLSLQKTAEGHDLMVQGGNAYVLANASVVIDAPDTDSGFNLTDRAVPFYQLAVNGLVAYSYQPLNSTTDAEWLFLKSIETGADLHLYFVSQNVEKLPDTEEYSKYVSVDPETWCKRIGDYYCRMREVGDATDGSRIVTHRALAGNVFETTWENGCSVITNYSAEPYVCEKGTAEPLDFLIMGRGD